MVETLYVDVLGIGVLSVDCKVLKSEDTRLLSI